MRHAFEVEVCFRTAEGYGPVAVAKTRVFEAILVETFGLPEPRTGDSVPVYALIKCIREKALTWGLPSPKECPGFDVLFFLGPMVAPDPPEDARSARSYVLVKTDTTILSFDAGLMRPPRKISGPDPHYTGQQGQMKVKCVVTVDGFVRNCRVLQGIRDPAAIRALEARRYSPAAWNDEPIEVDYSFVLNFLSFW